MTRSMLSLVHFPGSQLVQEIWSTLQASISASRIRCFFLRNVRLLYTSDNRNDDLVTPGLALLKRRTLLPQALAIDPLLWRDRILGGIVGVACS